MTSALTKFLETLTEFGFTPAVGRSVIGFGYSQIILITPSFSCIMGILVIVSMPQSLCTLVMSVTQVNGYGQDRFAAHILQG